MRKAGLILIIIGVVITLLAGATFITKKKVVDIGKLEITKEQEHQLPWTPVAGIIVIVAGIAILIINNGKNNT